MLFVLKNLWILGNKVDLLPPDPRSGYLKHFRQAVLNAAIDAGFDKKFNILHTALISAKTGFGVEDLVTVLLLIFFSHSFMSYIKLFLVKFMDSTMAQVYSIELKLKFINLIKLTKCYSQFAISKLVPFF